MCLYVGLQCRIDFPTDLKAPPLGPYVLLMEEILYIAYVTHVYFDRRYFFLHIQYYEEM